MNFLSLLRGYLFKCVHLFDFVELSQHRLFFLLGLLGLQLLQELLVTE